jgi:hypothetical protein
MKAFALLVLPLLWGCASETPGTKEHAASEFRRVDRRVTATEQFELRKKVCAEAGGVLQVRRYSGSRQAPRVKEMKTATCARAAGSAGVF